MILMATSDICLLTTQSMWHSVVPLQSLTGSPISQPQKPTILLGPSATAKFMKAFTQLSNALFLRFWTKSDNFVILIPQLKLRRLATVWAQRSPHWRLLIWSKLATPQVSTTSALLAWVLKLSQTSQKPSSLTSGVSHISRTSFRTTQVVATCLTSITYALKSMRTLREMFTAVLTPVRIQIALTSGLPGN